MRKTKRPFAFSRKAAFLGMTAFLTVVPSFAPLNAYAAAPTLLSPVTIDPAISWLGSPSMNGNTIEVGNLQSHYAFADLNAHPLSVASGNAAVATAVLNGDKLQLQIVGAGTADLTLHAGTDSSPYFSDRIQVLVTPLGDTTGDGQITSADALYIYKVVAAKTVLSNEEKNRLDINRDGVVTNADAVLLMNNYVGKTNAPGTETYIVALKGLNDAPFAYGISTNAGPHPEAGQTLTGAYHYFDDEADVEGASTLQWYVGDQADGSDRTPIAGATSASYVLQPSDTGRYVSFGVTPRTEAGDQGDPIYSTGVKVVDVTAPIADSHVPGVNATGVSTATAFKLVFNEPVTAVSGKHITIRKSSDASVVQQLDVADANAVQITGSTVTIKHAPLEEYVNYAITVDAGAFQDAWQNALAADVAWSFRTEDTVLPVLTGTVPAMNAINANPAADLVLNFSENVTAVSGKKIRIYSVGSSTPFAVIDADDTSKVTVNGTTATVKHATLADSTSYYVQVEQGAFADLSDNAYAGIADTGSWTFGTADTTAPKLAATSHTGNVTGAAETADLTLTFDESVSAVSGKKIKIYNAAGDVLLQTIDAGDTSKVTVNGAGVSVKHAALADVTSYYILVDAGAFEDLSANAYAGISDKAVWTFTTPDTTPPTAAAASHTGVLTAADKTADLKLHFSEAVTGVSGKAISIYNQAGDVLLDRIDAGDAAKVQITGADVTIKHAELADNTSYYVLVEAGAFKDTSDNPYAGITDKSAWAFVMPDTVAPTLISTSHTGTVTGEAETADLTLTFDESVSAVSGKKIKIYNAAGDVLLQTIDAGDTSKVTVNGAGVSVKHAALADVTSYYVLVDAGAFEDLSANAYAGISDKSVWTFTTPDATAPTLVSTLPADHAVNVAKSGTITFTFSEPITAVSGKTITLLDKDRHVNYVFDTSGTNAAGTVTVSGNTVVLTPAAALIGMTNYEVSLDGGAYTDTAGNATTAFAPVSFTTEDYRTMQASVASPLNEGNLTAAVVELDLADDAFLDADQSSMLDPDKIKLNGAPAGFTLALAILGDDHSATLLFDYDGTDFDVDYAHFSITIDGSVMASGHAITSSELPILAIVEPTIVSHTPASLAAGIDKSAAFTLTFSSNVTPVAGKFIRIYKSDNTLIQTINASTASLSGKVATIAHTSLADETSYYVLVDAGAFKDSANVPSEGIGGSNSWTFTTAAAPEPEVQQPGFFSEYDNGGNGRIALEIYYNGTATSDSNYTLWVYRWMKATNTMSIISRPLFSQFPTIKPYIFIDSIFYDAFDITPIMYFNDDISFYNPSQFETVALVLKRGSEIVDVLGNPNATSATPILSDGQMIVRKPGTLRGSYSFKPAQWTYLNNWSDLGRYTP